MKVIILILIISIIVMLASAGWLILLFIVMSKKVKNKEVLRRYLRMFMSLILMVPISACSPGKEFRRQNRYLVTVDTNKPKKIDAQRFPISDKVDSVVIRNFGFAIERFNSDSIFNYSPFFRIETLNKVVYGEKK